MVLFVFFSMQFTKLVSWTKKTNKQTDFAVFSFLFLTLLHGLIRFYTDSILSIILPFNLIIIMYILVSYITWKWILGIWSLDLCLTPISFSSFLDSVFFLWINEKKENYPLRYFAKIRQRNCFVLFY